MDVKNDHEKKGRVGHAKEKKRFENVCNSLVRHSGSFSLQNGFGK
jgi:hypothetical protein